VREEGGEQTTERGELRWWLDSVASSLTWLGRLGLAPDDQVSSCSCFCCWRLDSTADRGRATLRRRQEEVVRCVVLLLACMTAFGNISSHPMNE